MIRKLEKREEDRSLYYLVNESIVLCRLVCGSNPNMYGDCSRLRGDCSTLWGVCTGLSGDCTFLRGNCTGLIGDCSLLRGDCTGVIGNCTGLSGDFDLCEITDYERNHGVKVEDLIFKSEEEK